jgi:signal transduction histidine kinase
VAPKSIKPESLGPEFLHALLHDLKGPLARVRILGELLVRRIGSQDPEVRTLTQQISTEAGAAETVLEGVRRYAEALDRPFRASRFDLTLALNSALGCLASDIAATGAKVEHGPLPEIWGDMVQLSALFRELIANSLRFRSSAPPLVQIAAFATDPDYLAITVTDNGSGIPAGAIGRICRPLGKASERSGAGMGLAICRRIVDIHGGELIVNPLEQGTEIRVLLPH